MAPELAARGGAPCERPPQQQLCGIVVAFRSTCEQLLREHPLSAPRTALALPDTTAETRAPLPGEAGVAVDASYGSFIGSLGLSEQEAAELRGLLIERELERARSGAGPPASGDADPGRYNRRIEELIGESNFRRLEDHAQAEPERRLVRNLGTGLSADQALSPEQERELVDVLFEQRRAAAVFASGPGPEGIDLERFSEEDLARFEEPSMALVQRQLEAAQRILSPARLERLEADLQRDASLKVMGLEMEREMLQSATPPPGLPFPTESRGERP